MYDCAYKAFEKVAIDNALSWPIDIFQLVKNYKVSLITYDELAYRNNMHILDFLKWMPSQDGMYMQYKGNICIAYNNRKCTETQRFTIAHELGHIIMDHKEDTEQNDKYANCFARNLLCPADKVSTNDLECSCVIANKFLINDRAAKVRVDMIKTDLYYMKKLGIVY